MIRMVLLEEFCPVLDDGNEVHRAIGCVAQDTVQDGHFVLFRSFAWGTAEAASILCFIH
jgi:hypothetical protein